MAKKLPFTMENLMKLAARDMKYLIDKELFKENLRNYIVQRTLDGEGSRKIKFTKYSPSYAAKKKAAGLDPKVVNLSFTGEMLESLRVIEDNKEGNIKAGNIGTFRLVSDDKIRGFNRGNTITNTDIMNFHKERTYDSRPLPVRHFTWVDKLELAKVVEDTMAGIRYERPEIPKAKK